VDLYSEVAEAKSLILSMDVQPNLSVLGDRTRLRQAIANLVDNAVKYTPAGGHIVVKGIVDGDEAVLTVRDTGPGVPAAEQARVWERLYRGDASRSERGLGLGLALVRVIVEAHGGRVALRNPAEGGAEFELRLKLA
jgi:signal transduction histidine kinase